jgi:predicted alpha/beta hydrolase family esterase
MVPAERAFTTSLLRTALTSAWSRSSKDDVTATKRVLALQDGPSILVAHSYGGAVITKAETDPSIAGLVYVAAAHMPDAVELLR